MTEPSPLPFHVQLKYNNYVVILIIALVVAYFTWQLDNIEKDVNLKLEYAGAKMELNLQDKYKPDVKGAQATPEGTLRDFIEVSTSSAKAKGVKKT